MDDDETSEKILTLIEELNAEVDRLELQFEMMIGAIKVALEIARESGMEGDAMYFLGVLDTLGVDDDAE